MSFWITQAEVVPIEVKALVGCGFLYFALAQIAGVGKTMTAGFKWGMGNREHQPEFPAWVNRTEKAKANLGESLPLFAALIGACAQAGVNGPDTALAAAVFFYARVAHAGLFMAGIKGWRTVAYFLACGAMAYLLHTWL